MGDICGVYIPTELGLELMPDLARGSALAAFDHPRDSESVKVYFEGNVYGFANIRGFEDCAMLAASRLCASYPTIAMRVIPSAALARVGVVREIAPANLGFERERLRYLPKSVRERYFKPRRGVVLTGENQAMLEEWLR